MLRASRLLSAYGTRFQQDIGVVVGVGVGVGRKQVLLDDPAGNLIEFQNVMPC